MTSQRKMIFALAAAVLVVGATVGIIASGGGEAAPATAERPKDVVLTPTSVDRKAAKAQAATADPESHPKVVEVRGAGAKPTYSASASGKSGPSPGAPSDASVKADLREARAELAKFKQYLGTSAFLQTGPRAKVLKDGTAVAPEDAPEPVQRIIQAGNVIAKFPYKWGGGHGAWRDNGYDCSGSVSFALAAAGLLQAPMTSGAFMKWGDPGPGDYVTLFANSGHIFMYVAGLRFDTSGQGRNGTRWQEAPRSTAGFAVRHPPGF